MASVQRSEVSYQTVALPTLADRVDIGCFVLSTAACSSCGRSGCILPRPLQGGGERRGEGRRGEEGRGEERRGEEKRGEERGGKERRGEGGKGGEKERHN